MNKFPIALVVDDDDKVISIRYAVFESSFLRDSIRRATDENRTPIVANSLSPTYYNILADKPSLFYADINVSYMISGAPFTSSGIAVREEGIYLLNRAVPLPRVSYSTGEILDNEYTLLMRDAKYTTSLDKITAHAVPLSVHGSFVAVSPVGEIKLISPDEPDFEYNIGKLLLGSISPACGIPISAMPFKPALNSRNIPSSYFISKDDFSPIASMCYVQDIFTDSSVEFPKSGQFRFDGVLQRFRGDLQPTYVGAHINSIDVIGHSYPPLLVYKSLLSLQLDVDMLRRSSEEGAQFPLFPLAFNTFAKLSECDFDIDLKGITLNAALFDHKGRNISLQSSVLTVTARSEYAAVSPRALAAAQSSSADDPDATNISLKIADSANFMWSLVRGVVNFDIQRFPCIMKSKDEIMLGCELPSVFINIKNVYIVSLKMDKDILFTMHLTLEDNTDYEHPKKLIFNNTPADSVTLQLDENNILPFEFRNPDSCLTITTTLFTNESRPLIMTGCAKRLILNCKGNAITRLADFECEVCELAEISGVSLYLDYENAVTVLPNAGHIKLDMRLLKQMDVLAIPNPDCFIEHINSMKSIASHHTLRFFGSMSAYHQLISPLADSSSIIYAGTYQDFVDLNID